MSTEITIDLGEVRSFVEDSDFHAYLLLHTANFETAAWILQTLLNAVNEAESTIDNQEKI